jgi:hypothetical protein
MLTESMPVVEVDIGGEPGTPGAQATPSAAGTGTGPIGAEPAAEPPSASQ